MLPASMAPEVTNLWIVIRAREAGATSTGSRRRRPNVCHAMASQAITVRRCWVLGCRTNVEFTDDPPRRSPLYRGRG